MSKVFVRKNHGDPAAAAMDIPEMITRSSRPDIFRTKQEFVDWSARADTDHVFYSFYEGRNANERITKDNPPVFLHGFCGDYDIQNLEESAVERAVADAKKTGFPASFVSRTFSKGIRLLWVLDRPVPVFSDEIAKAVAKRAIKELKLNKLAGGFDEDAFLEPSKYYELGTEWRML